MRTNRTKFTWVSARSPAGDLRALNLLWNRDKDARLHPIRELLERHGGGEIAKTRKPCRLSPDLLALLKPCADADAAAPEA